MTIEKAIKYLSDDPETLDFENDPEALAALKLGIEALKAVQYVRRNFPAVLVAKLPGETEK